MTNKTEYIVLCGQIVGGGSGPFETLYNFDGGRFTDRKKAIKRGLKIRGSDDFNIGVVEDGKLAHLDWMEDPVDTDPDLMAKIAEQIALN